MLSFAHLRTETGSLLSPHTLTDTRTHNQRASSIPSSIKYEQEDEQKKKIFYVTRIALREQWIETASSKRIEPETKLVLYSVLPAAKVCNRFYDFNYVNLLAKSLRNPHTTSTANYFPFNDDHARTKTQTKERCHKFNFNTLRGSFLYSSHMSQRRHDGAKGHLHS